MLNAPANLNPERVVCQVKLRTSNAVHLVI